LPEFAVFCALHEGRILDDLQEKRLHLILGIIFSNQSTLGVIFACIFGEFAQILLDFARIFTNRLYPHLLHNGATGCHQQRP